jgi:hypothetical protein
MGTLCSSVDRYQPSVSIVDIGTYLPKYTVSHSGYSNSYIELIAINEQLIGNSVDGSVLVFF